MTVGTDVLWIRVDTSPLCNSLEKEALKWLHVFGEAFVEWIGQQVDMLREFLEKTHDEVHKPVTALHHLPGSCLQSRQSEYLLHLLSSACCARAQKPGLLPCVTSAVMARMPHPVLPGACVAGTPQTCVHTLLLHWSHASSIMSL